MRDYVFTLSDGSSFGVASNYYGNAIRTAQYIARTHFSNTEIVSVKVKPL